MVASSNSLLLLITEDWAISVCFTLLLTHLKLMPLPVPLLQGRCHGSNTRGKLFLMTWAAAHQCYRAQPSNSTHAPWRSTSSSMIILSHYSLQKLIVLVHLQTSNDGSMPNLLILIKVIPLFSGRVWISCKFLITSFNTTICSGSWAQAPYLGVLKFWKVYYVATKKSVPAPSFLPLHALWQKSWRLFNSYSSSTSGATKVCERRAPPWADELVTYVINATRRISGQPESGANSSHQTTAIDDVGGPGEVEAARVMGE